MFTTPEGEPVEVAGIVEEEASSATSLAKDTQKKHANAGRISDQVTSIKQFFTESKFGKNLKKFSCETKKVFKKAKVYQMNKNLGNLKKGDYFYLDRFHKDHLEVFDKLGNHVGILRFDGFLDTSKKITGRTIKNIL